MFIDFNAKYLEYYNKKSCHIIFSKTELETSHKFLAEKENDNFNQTSFVILSIISFLFFFLKKCEL